MDMYGLDHTYEQVKLMIEEELDYRIEGKSMQEIAANLELDDPTNSKSSKALFRLKH
jgi:predicted unusual protein kinase regulating ubiquinone biosynthesis (AarF/ABC1/UbiB family)